MDEDAPLSPEPGQDHGHRRHRAANANANGNGRAGLYRMSSNQSRSSIFEDVEMAHEELFSGPVAESLPTSVSAFSHRRPRADSTASFAYYDDDNEGFPDDDDAESVAVQSIAGDYIRRSVSDIGDLEFGVDGNEEYDESPERDYRISEDNYALRRHSSAYSRHSVNAHLLRRDSTATAGSFRRHGRVSQKVYLENEDLTIVIAGFKTSKTGSAIYISLCILTCGLAYLLFRWLPRWYVGLLGQATSLGECEWVVIENQWGELVTMDVRSQIYGRSLSTVFGLPEKFYSDALDEDVDPIIDDLRTLDYRYIRLCFHPLKDKFMLFNGWKDPNWTDVRLTRAGLDTDERGVREVVFGSNLIDIEQKTTGQLLVDEVLHPFYVFQIASLILWSMDSYYYYAIAIFLMSVGSIAATLIETRATMKRLREISRFECDVRVLRNGFWRFISSSELVPGDVYELSDPSLTQFPSDSLLLTGDCIVNESMLTGESVPVSKLPATDETLRMMDLGASSVTPETARHFLFCGTKIIRARRPQEDQGDDAVALALVVRTGFNTTKGALVRSMLFPKPSGFKFYRDSFRYISVMAIVAAIGFLASLVNFIRLGLAWHLIIVRALDLITIVVPPALPATLTIGTNFALSRLKKKQIFCISPQRVNVGGKIDIMCFDKTGTLTEEGLDVLGVRVVDRDSKKFSEIVTEPQMLLAEATRQNAQDTYRAALHTMATCHSLRSVDDELVGDPLDLKMFEFTRWTYEEGKQSASEEDEEQGGLAPSIARPPNGNIELGVQKSFEFVSNLRRASVIVRPFGQKSGDIFVKGAPEAMKEICRPESFPDDYDELLSWYTHKGYRVIGVASRHLKKLSWVKAQKMSRTEVESDLDFVGFIVFENKLKPTTAAVLEELLASNIGAVMVTGDNILTAISVARECGLMDRKAHCFVPRFIEGDFRDAEAKIQWESIDNNLYHLNEKTLLRCSDASLPLRDHQHFNGCVARMSPDEKHELVEKLQMLALIYMWQKLW
ncbi:hypothetical protein CEK25_005583 [Fusarium fujikuroi]|nr:hypothetical protein CEK25_005583 [Fusarium fujikuroi]